MFGESRAWSLGFQALAINALLLQYTRFINPLKYEALKNSIVSGGKGQDVSGIGVTLAVDKASKLVKIVDLAEGGPAEKAGLKRNSLFVEVCAFFPPLMNECWFVPFDVVGSCCSR